jgi:membrane associated rhomboid family serine protease
MLILPIGHQQSSVRRLPWVTFAVIVACVVAFLATDMEKAYELEDPAFPQFEEATADPATPRLPPDNPFVRWGLIPAHPQAHAFVTHLFMHGGWLHLLSNLFLFFLAAPPVEDRWGRPLFGAFYLLAGVFAGATHGVMTASPEMPLVGASGAIAGVLGVFFVRFWATKIKFFYFIILGFLIRTGTFQAPAWVMLPLWFANELFNIWMTARFGVETGVAYWAHVGGFAFGVVVALAVSKYRLEERFIHPAIEGKVTLLEGNPVIEQAMQAREAGNVEQAYGLLEAATLENPNDPDLAVVFWDAAVSTGRPETAAPAFGRAIRSCVVRGEVEQAGEYWLELNNWAPSARLDPTTLFRLAANLFERGEETKAARALEQALDPANAGLGPGLAVRIAELARERLPRVALDAARRALESRPVRRVRLPGTTEAAPLPPHGRSPAPSRSVTTGRRKRRRRKRHEVTRSLSSRNSTSLSRWRASASSKSSRQLPPFWRIARSSFGSTTKATAGSATEGSRRSPRARFRGWPRSPSFSSTSSSTGEISTQRSFASSGCAVTDSNPPCSSLRRPRRPRPSARLWGSSLRGAERNRSPIATAPAGGPSASSKTWTSTSEKCSRSRNRRGPSESRAAGVYSRDSS